MWRDLVGNLRSRRSVQDDIKKHMPGAVSHLIDNIMDRVPVAHRDGRMRQFIARELIIELAIRQVLPLGERGHPGIPGDYGPPGSP